MKNFVSACNSLHTCFSNIRCDKNKEYMLKSVENYCEFVAYVHVDFAECNEKLNDNGSKCFKNWEPMSIGIPDMNDEICEKIFKRKDCMKKDIVKTCGKKEWRSFREVIEYKLLYQKKTKKKTFIFRKSSIHSPRNVISEDINNLAS